MKRAFSLLIAAAALAGLAGAPAAAAKGKAKPKPTPVTTVRATATTDSDNDQVAVVATCPKGKIVVGGGFISPEAPTSGIAEDINIVWESRRASPNSWRVSAAREDNGSAGPLLPVTAQAYCRIPKLKPKAKKKQKLTITEKSATGPLAAGGLPSSATAACGAKQRPISGGFSYAPPPDLAGFSFGFVFQNYRSSSSSWTAALVDIGGMSRAVTSHAYCAPKAQVKQSSGAATLPAGAVAGNGRATAISNPCTKSRSLISVGFLATQPATGAAVTIITESSREGPTSRASGLNLGPADGTLEARAYCL